MLALGLCPTRQSLASSAFPGRAWERGFTRIRLGSATLCFECCYAPPCQWIDDGQRALKARPDFLCAGELRDARAALCRQMLVVRLLSLGHFVACANLFVQRLPVQPVSHGRELKLGVEPPERGLRAGTDLEADRAVKIIRHRRVTRRHGRPAGSQEI